MIAEGDVIVFVVGFSCVVVAVFLYYSYCLVSYHRVA